MTHGDVRGRGRDGELLLLGTPVWVHRAVLRPRVCSPPSTFQRTADPVSSASDPNHHDIRPLWPLGALCPSALPSWGLHTGGRAAGSGSYKPNPANLLPAPARSATTLGPVRVTVTAARGESHRSHPVRRHPVPGAVPRNLLPVWQIRKLPRGGGNDVICPVREAELTPKLARSVPRVP